MFGALSSERIIHGHVRANAAKFNLFRFGRERKNWLTAATFTSSNFGGAEKIASLFPA
jgi:hypothetical protein